jgi:glycogen(starch) synthase
VKIFFFSTVFAPSVGGVETVVELLCREFVRLGHDVRLATLTPGPAPGDWPFEVVRRPSLPHFHSLLRWADVHVQANVSLKWCWPRLLRPRRFLYQHNNVYQRDDGSLSLLDRAKRFVARRTPGIAVSRYVAAKLHCANVVLNPFDSTTFRPEIPWSTRPRDLVFVGRLVSQKGCDVLLRALALLQPEGLTPQVTIIGDGPDRATLTDFARTTSLAGHVHFAGTLRRGDLANALNQHRFGIVPSRYEEPFGVVALELLACGCVPIVSERGGLVDPIGPHGFTVPNGDAAALARCLREVLNRPEAAAARLAGVQEHLAQFHIRTVAERYLDVFAEVVARQ